jgi:hypothetical protein
VSHARDAGVRDIEVEAMRRGGTPNNLQSVRYGGSSAGR